MIVQEISLPIKDRNLCVKLLRKLKKDFYNNLNAKKIINNRKFRETIKPNFTDKTLKYEKSKKI